MALLFVLLHPLFLVLDTNNKFTITNVFFPLNAPTQSNIVLLGSLSMYALIIVIIALEAPIVIHAVRAFLDGQGTRRDVHQTGYPCQLFRESFARLGSGPATLAAIRNVDGPATTTRVTGQGRGDRGVGGQ